MTSRPRHATRRNPAAPTDGPLVGIVADALGTPFMPWQQLVADVAGEHTPDGAYAYPTVVVTVPRQSGKTTLMRARLVARCLSRPNAKVFYTAQTGQAARERWEDLVKQVQLSPFRSRVNVRRAAGSTRLEFYNGSELRVFSPVETAIHGSTPLEVHIDEAWSFDLVRGTALLGAIGPAQITVKDRQLWIVSTAGNASSTFLRQWVDAGRDGDPRVAFFEWSCPDGADPYDPAVVASFHPAAGYTQSAADIVASGAQLSRSEYERAYANRWTRASDALVSADDWAALGAEQTPPGSTPVVLGYDVAHDRNSADIVASWHDGTRLQVKVVRSAPGDAWVAAAVVELAARLDPVAVVGDDAGPARTVNAALRLEPTIGYRLRVLTTAEYASACGEWLAAVRAGPAGYGHDNTPRLNDAVADAVTRPVGDLWLLSRSRSRGPISALVGAVVAGYLAAHPGPAEQKPFITTAAAS